jgi:hypothetical protein
MSQKKSTVKNIKIKAPKKIAVRPNEFNGFSDPVLSGGNEPVLGEQIVSIVNLNVIGNPSTPLLQDIPNPDQPLPQAQFPVLSDFSNNPYTMPNPATFVSGGGTSSPANPASDIPADTTASTNTATTTTVSVKKWIPYVVGIIAIVAIVYIIKKIK